jgi:aminoglycoside phosphotransferase (APT) family kinase protein
LVAALVAGQFPHLAGLCVTAIVPGGWDHRSFRLGDEMLVRLPSAAAYSGQAEREARWLPHLAPRLPLEIPAVVALGEPGCGYPWKWSVRRWIEGETATLASTTHSTRVATRIAEFVDALHRIDARGGPAPGAHNFFRGGALSTYDAEARKAIAILAERIDAATALRLWDQAIRTHWTHAPRWVHGDLAAGNFLMRDGALAAVIDFGCMGAGDPACDLAVAWSLFRGEARRAFRAALHFDDATWERARGWALWKAAIVAAGMSATNAVEFADPWDVIEQVLGDPGGSGDE